MSELKYYQIKAYPMKCRLYLTKAQKKIVDGTLVGIGKAKNITLYSMIHDNTNTKEVVDKKDKNRMVHFPEWKNAAKKVWIDELKKNPKVACVPSIALSNSVNGALMHDLQQAWGATGKHPTEQSDPIITVDEETGKKTTEYRFPHYTSKSHPQKSWGMQATFRNPHINNDSKNVIRFTMSYLGDVKIRGWNKNIRFDASCEINFYDWLSIKSRFLCARVIKDNCDDYYIVFNLQNIYKPFKTEENKKEIGIDAGVRDILITSDGEKKENKRFKYVDNKNRDVEKYSKELDTKLSRRWGYKNEKFREYRNSF